MEDLKKLLREDHLYQLSDELMDKLISMMTEIKVKAKETIIEADKVNTNVYIVRSGVIRRSFWSGGDESTNGFAMPGTTIIAYHSFYHGKPSCCQYEACVDSTVMVIKKSDYQQLMNESLEFSQYVNSLLMAQLYYDEYKMMVFAGDAKDRYLAMMKNRPDVLRNVSLGAIASYLGVSQAYLSRLRRMVKDNNLL